MKDGSEDLYTHTSYSTTHIIDFLIDRKRVTEHEMKAFGLKNITNLERVKFAQLLLVQNCFVPDMKPNLKGDGARALYLQDRANVFLNREEIGRALHAFNRTLSVVEYQTKTSAACYLVRASIFERMGMWQEALEDLEIGLLTNDLDDDLLRQLLEQKSEAEANIAKLEAEPRKETFNYKPELKDRNKSVPTVSSALVQSGKRVVAGRKLKPGEIIAIDTAFCHRLLVQRTFTRCQMCLEPNKLRLIPCAFCTQAMYCSSQCLLDARKQFHAIECPIIEFLHKALDNEELLIVRLLLRAISCFETIAELEAFVNSVGKTQHSDVLNPLDDTYTDDQKVLHQILRLTNNAHLRTSADIFKRSILVALVTTTLVRCTPMRQMVQTDDALHFLMELMMRLAFIHDMNVWQMTNVAHQPYALAIYPFSGMLKHSCAPNVERFAYKQKMVLLPIQKLDRGEEITISYG